MLIVIILFGLVDKKTLIVRGFCFCLRLILLSFRAVFLLLFAKIQKTIGICKFIEKIVQIVETLYIII